MPNDDIHKANRSATWKAWAAFERVACHTSGHDDLLDLIREHFVSMGAPRFTPAQPSPSAKGDAFRAWQASPLYPKGSSDTSAMTNFDAGWLAALEAAPGVRKDSSDEPRTA